MKPHIRKVRGIWECRMRLCLNLRGFRFMARPISYEHPEMGHGYTVREAYEDWKAQMQAQRALPAPHGLRQHDRRDRMARNRRISDNDRHWGPFTLAKCGSYRSFGLHLDSGAGEYPGCNFNVLVGQWWFRLDLPPIIKPWRQWVDLTKYAWASGPGYWDEHARKYGIGLSPDGFVQVWHGAQTHNSTTDKVWCMHLPWTQWRHVRTSYYGLNGEHFWTEPKHVRGQTWDHQAVWDKRDECPTAKFLIEDYDGQKITATTRIEEREWLLGEKWCKWLSWFTKPRIRRSLDIAFSAEVGTEKGSWKGGLMGTGIEMLPGELHEQAFRRFCEQPVRNKYGPSTIKFLGRA